MSYDPKTFQRHADEAVLIRDVEEGMARVRNALFVGFLGPLSIGAIILFKFTVPSWAPYVILGTAPLAVLLLIVNWIRCPAPGRFKKGTLLSVVLTLAAAASTIPLLRQFSLL